MDTKYQPSCGSEFEWFYGRFCADCKRDDVDHNYQDGCPIVAATFAHGVDDEHYPKEWIYNKDDEPICTAFEPIKIGVKK